MLHEPLDDPAPVVNASTRPYLERIYPMDSHYVDEIFDLSDEVKTQLRKTTEEIAGGP